MIEFKTVIINSVHVNVHGPWRANDINGLIERYSRNGWAVDNMSPPFKDLSNSSYSVCVTFKRSV